MSHHLTRAEEKGPKSEPPALSASDSEMALSQLKQSSLGGRSSIQVRMEIFIFLCLRIALSVKALDSESYGSHFDSLYQ